MKTFAFTLLMLGGSFARADFPIFLTLYDFRPYGSFEKAFVREYEVIEMPEAIAVNPSGASERVRTRRYRKISAQMSSNYRLTDDGSGWQRRTVLESLERESLVKMLKGGYISLSLYKKVLRNTKIWSPAQTRIVVTWSALSLAEAERLFGGKENIPWHRVLGAEPPPGASELSHWVPTSLERWKTEKLKIVRSSLLVGSGQVINPLTGELEAREMAWQKTAAFADIKNVEKVFPLRSEFSRINVEGPLLPGSRREVIEFALAQLDGETRLHGYSPSEHGIFGRAIKVDRGNFFSRIFKMHILTSELLALLERDRPEGIRRVEIASPPSRPEDERELEGIEKDENDDEDQAGGSVFVTTLDKSRKNFHVGNVSHVDHELAQRLGHAVTPDQARELREIFVTESFSYFCFPNETAPWGPICLMDTSDLPVLRVISTLRKFGVRNRTAYAHAFENLAGAPQEMQNVFSEIWGETGIVTEEIRGIRIDNLTEKSVRKHGRDFLASVLLSVWENYQLRLDFLEPGLLEHLVTDGRDGFIVATTSVFIADTLTALGGKKETATAAASYAIDLTDHSVHHFVYTGMPAYVIRFDRSAISTLRDAYPRVARAAECPRLLKLRAAFEYAATL